MAVPWELTSLVINHLAALSKSPGLRYARQVVIPESNLAFEGSWLMQDIHRSGAPNVCIMMEDDNRAGVRVNHALKKQMAQALGGRLRRREVCFRKDFVCIGESYPPEEMKEEIVKQLLNYSCNTRRSKNNKHAPLVETYGGKGGYGFDDHVIALMINVIMQIHFFKPNNKYAHWK